MRNAFLRRRVIISRKVLLVNTTIVGLEAQASSAKLYMRPSYIWRGSLENLVLSYVVRYSLARDTNDWHIRASPALFDN